MKCMNYILMIDLLGYVVIQSISIATVKTIIMEAWLCGLLNSKITKSKLHDLISLSLRLHVFVLLPQTLGSFFRSSWLSTSGHSSRRSHNALSMAQNTRNQTKTRIPPSAVPAICIGLELRPLPIANVAVTRAVFGNTKEYLISWKLSESFHDL